MAFGASAARLLCSWLYMKVSWWALVTEPITSSSPLSDALGEAELELVSIATVGSRSERGEEDGEQEGAELGSSDIGSVALAGSDLAKASVWLLCSWLLFIMLFMALCISSSMRCFSRFGIRPKRTAEQQRESALGHALMTEITSIICTLNRPSINLLHLDHFNSKLVKILLNSLCLEVWKVSSASQEKV